MLTYIDSSIYIYIYISRRSSAAAWSSGEFAK